MPDYEYKVVPSPRTLAKERGVKGTEARFALKLTQVMNELGAEGWEFQRADTLPVDERRGLSGRNEVLINVLVFRRELGYRPPSMGDFTGTGEGKGSEGSSRLILEGAKRS